METNLQLLLTGIVHPLMRLYREEFKSAPTRPKLTFAQFRILNGIQRGRNQVGKLAEYQGISQPAMSKMVDGLVQSGLIKRTPQERDRRQIDLSLTARALETVSKIEKRVLDRIAKRIATLPSADQKAVVEGIVKISSVLSGEV